uniref:Uncharacterized protein n=1 Tax=Castor canadensis TaxID=51338 RepID=A0A8C1A040_CASCN
LSWAFHMCLETSNQIQVSCVLSGPMDGLNGTNSTRALRLPDGTSDAWYILTIIGIYGVIFLFRLASNILGKNDKALEDVYLSTLTSELKRKGLQSKVDKWSSLTISNPAVLQSSQARVGKGSAGLQNALRNDFPMTLPPL